MTYYTENIFVENKKNLLLLYGGLIIEPIFSNKMPLNENS